MFCLLAPVCRRRNGRSASMPRALSFTTTPRRTYPPMPILVGLVSPTLYTVHHAVNACIALMCYYILLLYFTLILILVLPFKNRAIYLTFHPLVYCIFVVCLHLCWGLQDTTIRATKPSLSKAKKGDASTRTTHRKTGSYFAPDSTKRGGNVMTSVRPQIRKKLCST